MGSRLKPHALAMRCFLLVGLALGSPAPQYSGSKSELTVSELGTIEDIFGSSGTYSSSSGKHSSQLNGNEVIVQVVTNEAGYVAPDDYTPSQGAFTNQATTAVDNVFENCADYTASQGYECVPYYQCHNGSIITDGGGLIDIRNGFGILSPEESKCPGFLDVCCLDPDFVPPPPPPIVKHVLLGSSSLLPTVLPSSSRSQPSSRFDVENGTPRTRQSPGPTRTDTCRPSTSTQSSTQGTSLTTGLSYMSLKTLTFRPT